MDEDSSHAGFVHATTTTGDPIRYTLTSAPANGTATVDPTTGAFTYTPNRDYFGSDSFQFRATDGHLRSEPATVSMQITNVNDPPVLLAIGDTTNSPESLSSSIALRIVDVDREALQINVNVADTNVATVVANSPEHSINVTPIDRGRTQIQVSVSDSEFVSQQTFVFEVRDVTKTRTIEADMAFGDMLTLTNELPRPVTVTLEHNGFPMFQSDEEIAQFVRDLPEVFPGEPFERKLWRFIRDSVYHNVPLNDARWLHDPWAVLNSQGWGFCGHASAAYVRVARAAGYQARVWGLSGHVVPEIYVEGRWQVFDPDLAVYYLTLDGAVAGLGDLTANPTLISAPVAPIFEGSAYDFPYSPVVTDIYASTTNNFIGDTAFLPITPATYQPLVLPTGARFTYPGRWTETVTGVDGSTLYEVPYFLQGKLTVPAGATEIIVMPWMLWELRGTGRVRIAGASYEIGSPELNAAIQAPGRQIANVEILESSSELEFIFFINAMRYGLSGSNAINVTGKDVWAVRVEKLSPPEGADFTIASALSAKSFAKPTPHGEVQAP